MSRDFNYRLWMDRHSITQETTHGCRKSIFSGGTSRKPCCVLDLDVASRFSVVWGLWNSRKQIGVDVFSRPPTIRTLNKGQQHARCKTSCVLCFFTRHMENIEYFSFLSIFDIFTIFWSCLANNSKIWKLYFNPIIMSSTTHSVGKSHIPHVPKSLSFLRVLQLLLGITLLGLSAYGINVYSTAGFDLTLFTVIKTNSLIYILQTNSH